MTYEAVADMVDSTTLARREHAAAATEGIDPPEAWVFDHRWKLAAQPGWAEAWDYAIAAHPDDGDPLTPPYDPGSDPGVITDGMILSAIQSLIEADRPPVVASPGSIHGVPHTDSKVVAEPLTAWAADTYSTFTDGMWFWDGGAWLQYVPPIPAPNITALEPSSASITDADFEGHIRGSGFTEDTVIIWNGAEENTRFIDSTDVWTTVVPSVVTAPTVLDVYVRNGDGQVSNILSFTWEA